MSAGFRSALSSPDRFETPTEARTRFTVSMVAAVLHSRKMCMQKLCTVHAWKDAAWTVGDMKASLQLVWG